MNAHGAPSSFEVPQHAAVGHMVHARDLPKTVWHTPNYDAERIMHQLSIGGIAATKRRVPHASIDSVKPSYVTGRADLSFDIDGLEAVAQEQAGDKFKAIVRMGGAFAVHQEFMEPDEAEALAVHTMGPDASLSLHSHRQAERGFGLPTMQQYVHLRFFRDLLNRFGNTQATINAYQVFSRFVPNFTPEDVDDIVLCGGIHDYGEAAKGRDMPYERKKDPNYVNLESAAAVDLAIRLHYPIHDPTARRLVDRRAASDRRAGRQFGVEHKSEIGHYLHPSEISRAIWGTERQNHGKLLRGDAFGPTIERIEYILSSPRAFDAVKHNINGMCDQRVPRDRLLRLGVSTIFNSLPDLVGRSRRYVYAYDFLQRNKPMIDRYVDTVSQIIAASPHASQANDYFSVDPFIGYLESEPRPHMDSRDEARAKFMKTAEFWRRHRARKHIVSMLWEAYIGTESIWPIASEDVSFLAYTAQKTPRHKRDGYLPLQRPPVMPPHNHELLAA